MQRLINCDFLNASGFKVNLSNKAKLLYFSFLTNADDRGFVGNAIEIAETLDRCEENFDNVLFHLKYVDAIQELVEKRLVFDFVDKVGNHTYLIRHWFIHNRYKPNLRTNFISYLSRVELENGKYQFKVGDEKPFKEKQSKINQNKVNQNNLNNNSSLMESSNNDDTDTPKADWEQQWDYFLKDIENIKGDKGND